MPITPEVERWLKEAGYEYHCFISYPKIRDPSLNECAVQVREAILRELRLYIPEPKVFLDVEMNVGIDWERKLRKALCGSVVMVAICAGIYYHPSHKWCGLEWAAMESLGQRRLPDNELRTIIPLMFRVETTIPSAVSKIQYIDISRSTLSGRGSYTSVAFKQHIIQVVGHIGKVAKAIVQNQAVTDCSQFEFPDESAFVDWYPADQAFPFHGKK
jgi:hypothetical protein